MKQKEDPKEQQSAVEGITLHQRKHYGCLAKVFCCKCLHCCQDLDISLLTSDNRKELFQKMIKRYLSRLERESALSVIMDPFFILVALLLGESSQIYGRLMGMISNQDDVTIFSKEDLQFYIPELCTYLVFHEELHNLELQKLMVRACKVDIHFSLKYYFYMNSLQILSNGQELTKYEDVTKYTQQFRAMINRYYQAHDKERDFDNIIHPNRDEEDGSIILDEENEEDKENIRNTLGGMHHSVVIAKRRMSAGNKEEVEQEKQEQQQQEQSEKTLKHKIKINKIRFLKQTSPYESFIAKPMPYPPGLFESTVNFFADLVELSNILVSSSSRKEDLTQYMEKVNRRLPATIYVPFTKESYQDLNIVSIVVPDSRVFNTKERAPYYICLQSFLNPTHNDGISRDKKIRSASYLKKEHLKKPHLFEDDDSPVRNEPLRESQVFLKFEKDKNEADDRSRSDKSEKSEKGEGDIVREKKVRFGKNINWSDFFNLTKIKKKILNEKDKKTLNDKDKKEEELEEESESKSEATTENMSHELVCKDSKEVCELFGESEEQQLQRISSVSPYSDLPGYKLIHIIIKSRDDLRQESFAMQLLQQFDKIFKMEHVHAKLLPYQVLPLSHEAGIIECVRDAVTIDELLKKGANLSMLLSDKKKRKNFMQSLVGYSLVTYFLQVKDRHNGNIMVKKDGHLLHIDYGFFLTNMPGKGVELEKNLPFKLTNEYVQALGGLKSSLFGDFRLLFFKAFNACRKHQHRIIILTKLMYSSYGTSMPCFLKGHEAIQQLEQRFNPPGVSSDAEMSFFCQNLINSSVDNWRSRWYDKWQYYMQGIFY